MRGSVAVLLLSLVITPPTTAGTVEPEVSLSLLSSGAFRSSGYARYRSIFGFYTEEPLQITHYVQNTDAWYNAYVTAPYSRIITSTTTGQPPNCYRAHLTGVADDSTESAISAEEFCYDGPPPPDGGTEDQDSGCAEAGTCNNSPLIISLDQGSYDLTGLADPVAFDLTADGRPEILSWTERNAELAFIALDRNGDGTINNGSELFGNYTPIPGGTTARDGFEALRALDADGNNVIDSGDPAWNVLLLWVDRNHDGLSQASELSRIAQSRVSLLETASHWTGRRDRFGNMFRYRSMFRLDSTPRAYYDIYFLSKP